MKHPYRRRLMYTGFQLMRALAQALPLGASRALGRVLGRAAYVLLAPYRRDALRHLAFAEGLNLNPKQRSRVARDVFVNLALNFIEWLRLPRVSAQQLQRWIDCQGLEHLRQALAQGNGAIVVTAHFGNWELIPLYLRGLGFEGGVLARRLRYPEYESFLIGMRGDKGVPTLARGSVKEVARLLRANQIVGVMPDQDIDSLEGVFINFFGHPAYTPAGPAALSLMTGAPILPCFLLRRGPRFQLIIESPVRVPPTRDRAHALALLTQAWSDVVERYIRQYPDHWVWMHRRWKTQAAPAPSQAPQPSTQPAIATMVLTAACSVLLAAAGCAKPTPPPSSAGPAGPLAAQTDQEMAGFTLTGYGVDGGKQWTLDGAGATVDGDIVTIQRPQAVTYDAARTAYIQASAAQVQQANRHVRLEHDVTIHTSDGLWLTSPVLHWIPDKNEVATDTPVRIETDHMLVRGIGATGRSELKEATILRDVEVVLNPTDQDVPGGPAHVIITCDGPLSFDYNRHIATFEQNVHVQDPNGDLYSDKLIAYMNEDTHTIRYAEAIGRVRIQQQQHTARSERAVYEPTRGTITLVGKPSLLIYPEEAHPAGMPTVLSGGLTPLPPPPESGGE